MENKVELIPASELPVAEGNEVDVLCVENGELKRKEGASLGGSVKTVNGIEPDEHGNVEVGQTYDLVIETNAQINASLTKDDFVIKSGSMKNCYEKIKSGQAPNAVFVFNRNDDSGSYSYHEYKLRIDSINADENGTLKCIVNGDSVYTIAFYISGTRFNFVSISALAYNT